MPEPNNPGGVISRDEVYTLDEFQARLRLGRHAMRSMRRDGLKTVKAANRTFVLGRHAIDFFESQASEQAV